VGACARNEGLGGARGGSYIGRGMRVREVDKRSSGLCPQEEATLRIGDRGSS
jgi:hypothetical protein